MATKTIIIDGPIGQYSFSKQFMRNELAGQSKNPVLIKISSLGGSVDDALNIYDQFIEHGNVTPNYQLLLPVRPPSFPWEPKQSG